jgi:hypothetical protein
VSVVELSSIERDASIRFHEAGTLQAVTRWISSHDEGIAEWAKNTRRAYQPDRADVADEHRVALLLFKDGDAAGPARIGLLDVGGATIEDVTAWSTWQDPRASSRGPGIDEEETQGNGGKAYMYRLFTGAARIVGVRDGVRNCKGFEGPAGSVDRGTPGFIPDAARGREVPVVAFEAELDAVLEPYGLRLSDLPEEVREAAQARQAFTLVEGVDPVGVHRGRIDVEDVVRKTIRHEQSTIAIQQVRIYAMHNTEGLEDGKPLDLPVIPPYPDFESPLVWEIPAELPLANGSLVSTTEHGDREKGRLILLTSKDNMPYAYKNLKPRWKISYRTALQMIGSKPVSDLAPTTPGTAFIYGTIELPALEPAYVDHGRRRPKDGPLVEAVDLFAAEKIKELARQINERRREDLDERSLDEVAAENRKLDEFKNRFLAEDGAGGGGQGDDGDGPGGHEPAPPPDYGTEPDAIELTVPDPALRIGVGVGIHLERILGSRVVDELGRTVPRTELEWLVDNDRIFAIDGDRLVALSKGDTTVRAMVKGQDITSPAVTVQAWAVDHVLLTPRVIEIPLGKRQQIVAEVTSDEGERATDVYLTWSHDADDQMIVRIRPSGWVTGNRVGRTTVSAGAGHPEHGGVWARIPVDVTVIPNPEEPAHGGGFPRLLLTGRDVDPATDEIREGDPDSPVLWQEPTDFAHNVWWLNLQSREAAFAFSQRDQAPGMWRAFHVQKLMDMVTQIQMREEFTKRGEDERLAYWADHKFALERHQVHVVQQLWEALEPYVISGEGLD